jgi:KDO2-lipid IV(A) lauroyltransferase
MYYFIYGLLYLISLLPFFILYGISDFAYFIIYRLAGYRKDVVFKNLAIAFPEKTEAERKQIAKAFFKNLIDTFIETIKMLSISEKEFNKRAIINLDECNALAKKGINIQFQSGHQMNWEYVNWVTAKNLKMPFVGVYMKIKNKHLIRFFISNVKNSELYWLLPQNLNQGCTRCSTSNIRWPLQLIRTREALNMPTGLISSASRLRL